MLSAVILAIRLLSRSTTAISEYLRSPITIEGAAEPYKISVLTPKAAAIRGIYSAVITFLPVSILLNSSGENPARSAAAFCLNPLCRIIPRMFSINIWVLDILLSPSNYVFFAVFSRFSLSTCRKKSAVAFLNPSKRRSCSSGVRSGRRTVTVQLSNFRTVIFSDIPTLPLSLLFFTYEFPVCPYSFKSVLFLLI